MLLKLKPATLSDCYFWWKVRNEKTVREVSFDPKPIPYSIHKKWFEEKLKDKNSRLFVILFENQKRGQLRLDKQNSEVEISLALTPVARGKGTGTIAIKLGTKKAISELGAKKVLAYTKPENLASIKAFEKVGFKNNGEKIYKGNKAILLEFSD